MGTFISLFSGIGGFDLALQRAGWQCRTMVEKDRYAQSVLRYHWPDVPLLEDVCDAGKRNLPAVDLVCGGFPCTDLSVAGRREGLRGDSSSLWFEFHRILTELRPRWVVIENVPGLLSSGPSDPDTGETRRGVDFAIILAGLTGLVPTIPANGWSQAGIGRGPFYNVAWRILDAQSWHLAQRRERVFIVGCLAETGGSPAEVLFESESRAGFAEPARPAWQSAASRLGGGLALHRWLRRNRECALRPAEEVFSTESETGLPATSGTLLAFGAGTMRTSTLRNSHEYLIPEFNRRVTGAVSSKWHKGAGGPAGDETYNLALNARNGATSARLAYTLQSKREGGYSLNFQPVIFQRRYFERGGKNGGKPTSGVSFALAAQSGNGDAEPLIAFDWSNSGSTGREGIVRKGSYAGAVKASGSRQDAVAGPETGVRRLTPTECERLQGFPDGWTAQGLDEAGQPVEQSDTQRYRQIGNAVAVPVVRWLVSRIPQEPGEKS